MNEIVKAEPAESQPPVVSVLNIIAAAASNPNVDMAKLEALLAMPERQIAKEAEAAYNRAFAAMEPELPRIKRNGQVEYKDKKSGEMEKAFKFARWEDIDAGIRPILRKHGFALTFNTKQRAGDGGGLVITATLRHKDGHSESAEIPLPLDSSGGKNNLQGAGSTFSYGKRYTATMLLNITTEGEDDDGTKGGARTIEVSQAAEIDSLVRETKSDLAKFLAVFGAASIQEMLASDYMRARNMLEQKKAKQGGVP